MNRLKTYYVYIYYDPRSGQPFYVGKGCGKRWKTHLTETEEKTDNIFKWRKINSIRQDGLEPQITKHTEQLTEDAAYNLEKELIQKWGRQGIDEDGILTNRCEDLRPPSAKGKKFSEEHRAKMKVAYWKRVTQPGYVHPCKGKKLSDIEKEMARQANLGRVHTEEHRRKNSEAKKFLFQDPTKHPMYGTHRTEETKQKIGLANSQWERSPEQLQRLHKSNLGSHRTKESKQKIANALAAKWKITDPDGNCVIIENLRKWCKEHGYSQGNFWNVANGRLPHAYGYKCEKLLAAPQNY